MGKFGKKLKKVAEREARKRKESMKFKRAVAKEELKLRRESFRKEALKQATIEGKRKAKVRADKRVGKGTFKRAAVRAGKRVIAPPTKKARKGATKGFRVDDLI